jgi:hypothetical protein
MPAYKLRTQEKRMASKFKLALFACFLTACVGEEVSFRNTKGNIASAPAAPSAPATGEANAEPVSFQPTQADLRPLSKMEIQHSLQDVLLLSAPPELEGFVEQSSKSQIFSNSYGILNDSSSLAGLNRDIGILMDGMDWSQLSKTFLQCDALVSPDCRGRLVQRIAAHAWRRPLEIKESQLLDTQARAISRLDATVQMPAFSQLMSQIFFDPRFLFRSEIGGSETFVASAYALAPWEKLSSITYNLKHRPPSFEQIQSLADFENDPARFQQLIDEIIQSPALGDALATMISQWLMYYGLESMDIQGDPNWSPLKAKEQMNTAHQFVTDTLMREGTLRALFSKPNPENDGYGIFSSKAFLTSTSKHGQGSMILRGVRIIRNALCQGMGVPPGTLEAAAPKDLSPLDPNYDIKLTLLHGARPDCAACHRLIDPAGLALHTFDGFGANTNSLVDFNALSIPSQLRVGLGGEVDTISTVSAKDFAESMVQSTSFVRCFSRNALRYVLGRDLTAGELMTADQLADKHLGKESRGKESLTNYFRDIMTTESVYMRTR